METTTASHFKARLGHYMKLVRGGQEVVVTDRDRPIARFVPFRAPAEATAIQLTRRRLPDAPPLGQVEVQPIEGARSTDSTATLRADRDRR